MVRFFSIKKVISFIIVSYILYIAPCFLGQAYIYYRGKDSPVMPTPIPTPKPTTKPIPTPKSTPKPEQTPVFKPTPTPIIKIVYNDTHIPPVLSNDIIELYNRIRNVDLVQLVKEQRELEQEIEEFEAQISNLKVPQATVIKQLDPTVELNEELVNKIDTFFSESKNKDTIPLILTSVFSKNKKIGKPLFNVLFSKKGSRYGDDIKLDATDRFCTDSNAANFSYWTPYPIWMNSFDISYTQPRDDDIRSFRIQLLLGKQPVYTSESVVVTNGHGFIALSNLIRFDRVRVIAEGKGNRVCIGKANAYGPLYN